QNRLARTQFETAYRMPEFRAAGAVQLGELSAREGDRAQAIAYLREALRSAPGDQRSVEDLAMLERSPRTGFSPELPGGDAERLLDTQIPVLHASLGRVLLRLSRDTQGAFEAFQAGLTADPQNAELYDGVATASAILGRPASERTSALERYPDKAHMPTPLV